MTNTQQKEKVGTKSVKPRAFVIKSSNLEWLYFAAVIPGKATEWFVNREDAQYIVDKFNSKIGA